MLHRADLTTSSPHLAGSVSKLAQLSVTGCSSGPLSQGAALLVMGNAHHIQHSTLEPSGTTAAVFHQDEILLKEISKIQSSDLLVLY